jgi:hypothetical protein
MSLVVKILKMAGTALLYLIVVDVVGVVISFVLDVLFTLPLAGASAAAFYALWLVLGIFCGLFSYGGAKSHGSARLALAVSIALVLVLGAGFGVLLWGSGSGGNYFVPDNLPLTLTFFAGNGAGSFLGYQAAV